MASKKEIPFQKDDKKPSKSPKKSRQPPSDHLVEYEMEESDDAPSLLDIASCDGPVRFHRILNPTLMDTEDDDTNGELDVVSEEDNTSADGSKMHGEICSL